MRASILVCRRIFTDVLARLREHFEVEANDADNVWSRAEMIARLQGKDGVFVTGTQPIDAALLAACRRLRAVCSLGIWICLLDPALGKAAPTVLNPEELTRRL